VVTDISVAMAQHVFTLPGSGGPTGFGGPRTGWAHQGPAFGDLEAMPHGPVHVQVGGLDGLMTDPNRAALDPIFWLHHANIDRLWEVWRRADARHVNPTSTAWLDRRFALRDDQRRLVRMTPRGVVNSVSQLDYTYDSLPAQDAADEGDGAVPRRRKPLMIGASARPVTVDHRGGSTVVDVGDLPELDAADAEAPRLYLDVADIEGTRNPGVVYGVYLNLPQDASPATRSRHQAGVVSFFGIEQAGPGATRRRGGRGRAEHGLRYTFDVTELVGRLRAGSAWDPAQVRVELLPVGGTAEPGDAAPSPTVTVGSFRIYAG
jgi:hypothetical protein